MEIQNSFVVPANIGTAWTTLQAVEQLAPCVPGASLAANDGERFEGSVKVKLGPVVMTYGGTARFASRDESTYTAVIEGTGKETKGAGTAMVTITAQLVAEKPDQTRCDVNTNLTITGRAAQFGRGTLQDVAGRIIDQFADNLAVQMAGAVPPDQSSERETPGPIEVEGGPKSLGTATAHEPFQSIVLNDKPVDLLSVAGVPVLKRVIVPAIAVAMVIGLIVWIYLV